jgi:hypothetical protein
VALVRAAAGVARRGDGILLIEVVKRLLPSTDWQSVAGQVVIGAGAIPSTCAITRDAAQLCCGTGTAELAQSRNNTPRCQLAALVGLPAAHYPRYTVNFRSARNGRGLGAQDISQYPFHDQHPRPAAP